MKGSNIFIFFLLIDYIHGLFLKLSENDLYWELDHPEHLLIIATLDPETDYGLSSLKWLLSTTFLYFINYASLPYSWLIRLSQRVISSPELHFMLPPYLIYSHPVIWELFCNDQHLRASYQGLITSFDAPLLTQFSEVEIFNNVIRHRYEEPYLVKRWSTEFWKVTAESWKFVSMLICDEAYDEFLLTKLIKTDERGTENADLIIALVKIWQRIMGKIFKPLEQYNEWLTVNNYKDIKVINDAMEMAEGTSRPNYQAFFLDLELWLDQHLEDKAEISGILLDSISCVMDNLDFPPACGIIHRFLKRFDLRKVPLDCMLRFLGHTSSLIFDQCKTISRDQWTPIFIRLLRYENSVLYELEPSYTRFLKYRIYIKGRYGSAEMRTLPIGSTCGIFDVFKFIASNKLFTFRRTFPNSLSIIHGGYVLTVNTLAQLVEFIIEIFKNDKFKLIQRSCGTIIPICTEEYCMKALFNAVLYKFVTEGRWDITISQTLIRIWSDALSGKVEEATNHITKLLEGYVPNAIKVSKEIISIKELVSSFGLLQFFDPDDNIFRGHHHRIQTKSSLI